MIEDVADSLEQFREDLTVSVGGNSNGGRWSIENATMTSLRRDLRGTLHATIELEVTLTNLEAQQ